MLLVMLSAPAFAHHSFATHYDLDDIAELTGTITEVSYRNPHSFFQLEVREGDGVVERWDIEAHAIPLMRRLGIEADTIQLGDTVTVKGPRSRRTDKKILFGGQFILADGTQFMLLDSLRANLMRDIAVEPANSRADTPLHERLAGRWAMLTGSVGGFGDSPMPLTSSGREARAAFDPRDTPALQCIPPNLPSLLYQPYLYELRAEGAGLVLQHEYAGISRPIVLDAEAEASTPPAFGSRRSRIVGETLIVESRSFPPDEAGLASDWDLNGRGANIPSSDRKELIERYTLRDGGAILVLDYTVTDPVYLTEPYSARIEWQRVRDDAALYEFECDVEAANRSKLSTG
jgi:hypothetical protein